MKKTILIIIILILINMINAQEITICFKPMESGIYHPNSIFQYTLNFTSDNSCTNVITSKNLIISTDSTGVNCSNIDLIGNLNTINYICEYRGNVGGTLTLRRIHNMSTQILDNLYGKSANFTQNISADWFNGNISYNNIKNNPNITNYSYYSGNSNSTTWWASVSGWVSGWFQKDGNNLNINSSKVDSQIVINSPNLNVNNSQFWQGYTPQTYNSTYINGFFYPKSNPSNFINSSSNASFDKTNIAYTNKSNIFNESQSINGSLSIGTKGLSTFITLSYDGNYLILNRSINTFPTGFYLQNGAYYLGFRQTSAVGAIGEIVHTNGGYVQVVQQNGNLGKIRTGIGVFGNSYPVVIGDNANPFSPTGDNDGIKFEQTTPSGFLPTSSLNGQLVGVHLNTPYFSNRDTTSSGTALILDDRGSFGRFSLYTYEPQSSNERVPMMMSDKNGFYFGDGIFQTYGQNPETSTIMQATLGIRGRNLGTAGSDDYPTLVIERAGGAYGQQNDLTQWRDELGDIQAYINKDFIAYLHGLTSQGGIYPSTTNTYSLGGPALIWANVFFRDLIFTGEIFTPPNIWKTGSIPFVYNGVGGNKLNTTINFSYNYTTNTLNIPNLNQTKGNATINNYYGGMHFHNDSGISFNLNATFRIINLFNESENTNGFIKNNNSTMELIDDGGMYKVDWITQLTGTNNHEYEGYIFVNEVLKHNTYGRGIGQASNEVDLRSFGFVRINKYDNVTLRVADVSGTTTASFYHGNLNLLRVGN